MIYAAKVINKASLSDSENDMLRHEINIVKSMEHPNIVKFEDVYQTATHTYIVSEIVNGGELQDYVLNCKRLNEDDAALVIFYLLKAIEYIHSCGIIHRDLKPENVLISARTENDMKIIDNVKLIDFGLARMTIPGQILLSQCGTLSFIAPEVLLKTGYFLKADIWSLGMILFFM